MIPDLFLSERRNVYKTEAIAWKLIPRTLGNDGQRPVKVVFCKMKSRRTDRK